MQMRDGFQSIGVTKDWRPDSTTSCHPPRMAGFQSIGVTKDWRLIARALQTSLTTKVFPINRRHQGLATGIETLELMGDIKVVSNQ